MAFSGSTKKAPAVFFEVFDDTGAPTLGAHAPASSVIISNPVPATIPLTVDITYFTVDNTNLTVDMVSY